MCEFLKNLNKCWRNFTLHSLSSPWNFNACYPTVHGRDAVSMLLYMSICISRCFALQKNRLKILLQLDRALGNLNLNLEISSLLFAAQGHHGDHLRRLLRKLGVVPPKSGRLVPSRSKKRVPLLLRLSLANARRISAKINRTWNKSLKLESKYCTPLIWSSTEII